MKTDLPIKMVLLLASSYFTSWLYAQPVATAGNNEALAVQNAVQAYHQSLSPQTNLYNGSEYVDYAYTLNEGIPFFETAQFSNGAVAYDSVLYQNVPLLYDEVKGEVIIRDFYNRGKIVLNPDHIDSFSILNHHFVKLLPDSTGNTPIRAGFYDVLYNGNMKVYKREIKKVMENITVGLGLRRTIDEQDEYFIKKENNFYAVSSKKSVLSVTKDKKKEVQQFIKKNKLNLRSAKEIALTRIAAYYDQLTTK